MKGWYNMEKKGVGDHTGNQYTKVEMGHFDPFPNTAARLAEEYGVSEKTIKRDGKFAEATGVIDEVMGEEAYNLAHAGKGSERETVSRANCTRKDACGNSATSV